MITLLLRVHTTYIWVQFSAHIPVVVNHAFNVTPRSGNKTIHCKIFAQTGFLLEKVHLNLMMSHLQQLFALHWYIGNLGVIMITAHTSIGVRWIFPWTGLKNCSRGPTAVKFDFINSKRRERYFLTKNLMNKYQLTTSTGLSSLPLLKLMHTSTS